MLGSVCCVLMEPLMVTKEGRRNALLVAIGAFGLLAVAFFLTPNTAGIGTHHQLGLPKCGWIAVADLPCPTCGMTTSFSYTVRGQFISAFFAQPLGLLLAIATGVIGVFALITVFTGRSFALFWYRFATMKYLILIAVLALIAWGFKILIHRGII